MLNSPVEEIKNKLDIVQVVGGYIKLSKAGINYRAVCPFHSEKKPSFFVSPNRQIWHCFGCQIGGDIFKFVMQIEGVEFGDALRILAQRAGVELKWQDPKLKTERQRLYEICELACRFFEKQLEASEIGETVKKYLLGRGLNEDSIKEWRLGYSPDSWQGLSDFLVGQGYGRDEIEKAGLAIKQESKFYDRFRARIMFPVLDLNSQVVGFGGRVFQQSKEEIAKYVNTPATILYDKGRILYGLDRAKVEIRKKDSAILVEGYVDAIMVAQAGFKNVAAVAGTALTHYQLQLLKRYTSNLFVSFDMDIAGSTATRRGIDLAQREDFNIKIVTMPDGQDPADVIFRSPKEWEELVDNSCSILQFYFENAFSRFDRALPEGKKKISELLLPAIKIISNKIEQSFWIQKLAKDLEVREEDVREQLKNTKDTRDEALRAFDSEQNPKPAARVKTRKELLEENMACLVLKSPKHISLVASDHFDLFSPDIREIMHHLKNNPVILSGQDGFPADLKDRLDYLYFKADVEGGGDDLETEKEIKTCLKEIKSVNLKENLNNIAKEIKQAEVGKDFEKVKGLLARFKELSLQLNN